MKQKNYTRAEVLLTPPTEKHEPDYLDGIFDFDSCSANHLQDILNHTDNRTTTLLASNTYKSTANTFKTPPRSLGLQDQLIYGFIRLHNFFSSKGYRPSGYWKYVFGVYKNLFLVFYFNWFSIFTSPLSSLAFLTVYPVVSLFLFLFEIGLKICMDYLGGEKLINQIRQNYGHNLSMINWGAPQLLVSNRSIQIIKSALPALGVTMHGQQTMRKHAGSRRHLTFDIAVAQTMAILSSLVYERQDEKVAMALNLIAKFQADSSNQLHGEEKEKAYHSLKQTAKRLIWESEASIREMASRFGLCFAGVTEMRSLTGPYCGLFWPEDNDQPPFIIVTFKGTTPTNYSEFLVDATFQRTDARPFLFGSVHQGFYESLFATNTCGDNTTSRKDVRDPYYVILNAIRKKAKELLECRAANHVGDNNNKLNNQRVPVWLAGHSLGAGLSTLLFARWLKCPEDLGALCQLRDAYVIGLPAVGDTEFAANFASYTNKLYYQSQDSQTAPSATLWRIVNQFDIICRIPPGYNSSTVGHYAPRTDFFNYAHVGQVVQITHPLLSQEPLKMYPSCYESTAIIDIVDSFSSTAIYCSSTEAEESASEVVSDSDNSEPSTPIPHETHQDMKPLTSGTSSEASLPWWLNILMHQFQFSNPVTMFESVYPFFVRDHIPIHYFEGIDRAREYINDN